MDGEKSLHCAKRKVIPLRLDAAFFSERAEAFLDRLKYDKALKYYRRAVEYEPDNPINHCNMAGVLAEMGKYDESNDVLQMIISRIDPSMTECYFYMANNFAHMQEYEKAEEALVRYLEEDENGYYLDESEEMMEFLAGELERPPKLARIRSREGLLEHDRARALLAEGRFSEAIRQLENIIAAHPDFPAAHNNLALAYFYTGRLEEAFAAAERVLKMDPGNLHGLCNMAIFLQHAGKHGPLQSLLARLEKTVPYDPDQAFKLATTLGMMGRHKSALSHFRRLLREEAGRSDPYLNHYAAAASCNIGRYEAARRYWERAEKLDQGGDVPKFYLEMLEPSFREGAGAGGRLRASYPYRLPFEEVLNHLQHTPLAGEAPNRMQGDPLLHSSLVWALRRGSRRAKLAAMQACVMIGGMEAAEALSELAAQPGNDDDVKRLAVVALREMGVDGPIEARIAGKPVTFLERSYMMPSPHWRKEWREIADLAAARMARRFSLLQQFYMVKLWEEFLRRMHPGVPVVRKKEGWAAALEYLTAKMHGLPATCEETARRYGVSAQTVGRHAARIDAVCSLADKVRPLFAHFANLGRML